MRGGRLDRRIVIEEATQTRDELGAIIETWATWRTIWAQVTPMTANDRFLSDALRPARTNKFRIRYLAGISEQMRITFEDRTYKITGIAEIGRREGYELTGESYGT